MKEKRVDRWLEHRHSLSPQGEMCIYSKYELWMISEFGCVIVDIMSFCGMDQSVFTSKRFHNNEHGPITKSLQSCLQFYVCLSFPIHIHIDDLQSRILRTILRVGGEDDLRVSSERDMKTYSSTDLNFQIRYPMFDNHNSFQYIPSCCTSAMILSMLRVS